MYELKKAEEISVSGKGSALLLEISTPCEIDDNYFENAKIPIGGGVMQ